MSAFGWILAGLAACFVIFMAVCWYFDLEFDDPEGPPGWCDCCSCKAKRRGE